jgi:hypothetical protein
MPGAIREFFSYSAFTIIFARLFPDFRHCCFGSRASASLWNLQLESPMKKLLAAALFAAVIATPALAESFSLVRDTVGNCAAVVTSKSPYPGMKVVSHKTYTSWDEASKALDSIKVCTNFVR